MSNPVDLAARMLSHVTMTPFGDLPKEIQTRAVTLIEDLLTDNSTRHSPKGFPEPAQPIPASRLGGISSDHVIIDELLGPSARSRFPSSLVVQHTVDLAAEIEFAIARLAVTGAPEPRRIVTIAQQLATRSTVSAGAIVERIARTYEAGVLRMDTLSWFHTQSVVSVQELERVLDTAYLGIAGEVQSGRVKPEHFVHALGLVAESLAKGNRVQQALAGQGVEVTTDDILTARGLGKALEQVHGPDRPNRRDRRRNKRKRG